MKTTRRIAAITNRKENKGGGVIFEHIVDIARTSREAGHYEMLDDADHDQGEGMNQQHQEPNEEDDVKNTGQKVARLLPLTQPKFQNPSQSQPWPVKTQITFCAKKRYQALRHNVGKTRDTQKWNE